nr:SDR family NAD(P)-dependent oxidoreductase [Coleofasciculus sp. FACHB-SPT36]
MAGEYVLLNSNGNFTDKVAFVTGAANGIGRATALAFAREGANVVVADISEQGNQETVRIIEELDGRAGASLLPKAIAIRCDVTRAEDVKAALDKTIEPEFGLSRREEKRIDIERGLLRLMAIGN